MTTPWPAIAPFPSHILPVLYTCVKIHRVKTLILLSSGFGLGTIMNNGDPHKSPLREDVLVFPFHGQGGCGTEASQLLTVAHLTSDELGDFPGVSGAKASA